jgi:hypothetical protein
MWPQADHEYPSTLVYDEKHYVSWTSRSPSVVIGAGTIADYQEWPFYGFLKHTRVRDDVM